ncbi:hypothetical protein RI367_008749 [Sorochytrium milnesiophthora]
MTIFVRRITSICARLNVLRGRNFSALSGSSVDAVIAATTCALESLERLKLPARAVSLYMDAVFSGRMSTALAVYGDCCPFPNERGLPQGGVESLLLWRVIYDPAFCAADEICLSVTMKASYTIDVGNTEQHMEQVRVVGLAYVDDSTWFSTSAEDMTRLLELVDDFNRVTNIRANPAKGAIMALNVPRADRHTVFRANNVMVPRKGPTECVRSLGVFMTADGRGRAVATQVREYMRQAVAVMSPKLTTARQATYILNSVVLPSVAYRFKGYRPTHPELQELDVMTRGLVKSQARLARNTPSIVMHCSALGGLLDGSDLVVDQTVTELIVRLNVDSIIGTITRIQLLRLKAHLHTADPPTASPTRVRVNRKLNVPLLPLMFARGLSIRASNGFGRTRGGYGPLDVVLPWPMHAQHRNALRKQRLYFATQLMGAAGPKVLLWRELRQYMMAPLPKPAWFTDVSAHIRAHSDGVEWRQKLLAQAERHTRGDVQDRASTRLYCSRCTTLLPT